MNITPNDITHMTKYLNTSIEDQRQLVVQLSYELELERIRLEALVADLKAILPNEIEGE